MNAPTMRIELPQLDVLSCCHYCNFSNLHAPNIIMSKQHINTTTCNCEKVFASLLIVILLIQVHQKLLELDYTIPTRLLPTTREMVTIFAENASKAKEWEKKHRGGEGKHKKKKKL
jgi:hypothetical protein